LKIAICTPYYDTVAGGYAVSLANMINWTLREAKITYNGEPVTPNLKVFTRTGSLLARLRNALAKDAVTWDANYLLWIDADQVFPERSLLQLLSHNLAIVGVNQPRREYPTGPNASDIDGNPIWTTEELGRSGAVAEVGVLGLGLCLIDMRVVHTLRDGNSVPLFSTAFWGEGIHEGVGEDTFFFNRVREAGFSVHLDHGLSWNVYHSSTTLLTNADTVAQRELYLAKLADDRRERADPI
jgi:hypothetical protein